MPAPLYLPYPLQLIWQGYLALCPDPVSLGWIPLGQPPFLHLLRHPLVVTDFVRRFPGYYEAVRLPTSVHHGRAPFRGSPCVPPCNLRWLNAGSPDSRSRCFRACMGSPTPPSPHTPCHIDMWSVAFRALENRRHSNLNLFRGSIPSLHVPLSTLRYALTGRQRMTRGQCGWLNLHCWTLSFLTPCRF